MDQETRVRLVQNLKWLSNFLTFRTEWGERFDHIFDQIVSFQKRVEQLSQIDSADKDVFLNLMTEIFEFVVPILRETKPNCLLY
jgi:hypothetical protein